MSSATASPSAGENGDVRFDLAMAAAGAERRNRPRFLLVVAIVVFLVCGLVALQAMGRRSRAEARLTGQLAISGRVEAMLAEFAALQAKPTEFQDAQIGQPIDRILTNIENYAAEAGIKDPPRQPPEKAQQKTDIVIKTYSYSDVRSDDLQALLRWVEIVLQRIPGMQVESITLKPDGKGWKLSVAFRRWEWKNRK